MKHEQRVKLLEAHNNLKEMLDSINEIKDIYLSDIKKIEDIVYMLQKEFAFEPKRFDDGSKNWYAGWVLKDINAVDPDGEQPPFPLG